MNEALALHGAGSLAEAARLYKAVLKVDADHTFALSLLGALRSQESDHADALKLLDRSLKIDRRQPLAFNAKGIALKELKRPAEALSCFGEAVSLKPDFAEAFCNRGNALRDLKRYDEAIADYRRATALAPRFAEAFYNLGLTLQDLHLDNDALGIFAKAIAINPGYADAYNASGNSLQTLRRHAEALEKYQKAASLKAGYLDAWTNTGDALRELHRYEEALQAYEQALAIRAKTPDTYAPTLLCQYVFTRMALCDWAGLEKPVEELVAAIKRGKAAPAPFPLLAAVNDPALQRRCAELYVKDRYPVVPERIWKGERYKHDRIRIGYLSADFRAHAVSYLMAGVIEHHDRKRFEIVALSMSENDGSAVRKRIEAAADRFIDIERLSDAEVARLMRSLEIDIAVDLTGLTQGARPEILARRPAPIQVCYLGYPGTTAQPSIDYLIADRVVVPPEDFVHYKERIAYLPGTYLCSDSKRPIAERTPSRAEAGLPETGFVFCSFNNSYKFSPTVFDVWMRILSAVPGSVLWLPDASVPVCANLRREAKTRGVAPERLIFAPKLPSNADHLARLRCGDLFLDTLPYNAHTTASDALWAGLPVLTCRGKTFAGRVAASLLGAVGLPELIADSLEDYQKQAVALANDPARLTEIGNKLARNRETHPLFDTARFTRNLERAFETMWRRGLAGQPPETFSVEVD